MWNVPAPPILQAPCSANSRALARAGAFDRMDRGIMTILPASPIGSDDGAFNFGQRNDADLRPTFIRLRSRGGRRDRARAGGWFFDSRTVSGSRSSASPRSRSAKAAGSAWRSSIRGPGRRSSAGRTSASRCAARSSFWPRPRRSDSWTPGRAARQKNRLRAGRSARIRADRQGACRRRRHDARRSLRGGNRLERQHRGQPRPRRHWRAAGLDRYSPACSAIP